MKIIYRKQFLKQFKKLERRKQLAVNDAIDCFRQNPHDARLHNHSLQGHVGGKRAISAGFDLRIVFEERDGYAIVIMIAVGRHETVY